MVFPSADDINGFSAEVFDNPGVELMSFPKVLLVSNTSWYLYNFRLPLIKQLETGYTVELVAPVDEFTFF